MSNILICNYKKNESRTAKEQYQNGIFFLYFMMLYLIESAKGNEDSAVNQSNRLNCNQLLPDWSSDGWIVFIRTSYRCIRLCSPTACRETAFSKQPTVSMSTSPSRKANTSI